jgi:AcrR family transcriptional regulator
MPSRKTLMPLKNNTAAPRRARPGAPRAGARPRGRRDPDGTRTRILEAARHEFAANGYAGARIDRISRRAKTFDRMLYYHFGNKEALFRLVLERAYEDLWAAEETLALAGAEPVEGLRQLIAFTWNYYYEHPEFIRLLNSENLQRGRNLRKSARVGKLSSPFIRILADLLRRGAGAGVFRGGVDPVKLYITIASLGYFYLSNRYTLSRFLDLDLVAPARRAAWLEHITGVVLDHLAPARIDRAPGRGNNRPQLRGH